LIEKTGGLINWKFTHRAKVSLHLLATGIWPGGHIVLSIVVFPRALRERSPEQLLQFESVYEKIGMPALII